VPGKASTSPSKSTTELAGPSEAGGADRPPLLEVGRIVKAHGLRGEVVVELTTDRDERVAPGTTLWDRSERAYEVLRSSPHQGRWIVAFAGVADRTAAEGLRGTVLLAEALDDPDVLWVHELIGSEAFDAAGKALGRVVAVQANPASDLLELEGGALVPVRFLMSASAGTVVVDPPPGLLELYAD
jgi:16S rRNA processing protein RimM